MKALVLINLIWLYWEKDETNIYDLNSKKVSNFLKKMLKIRGFLDKLNRGNL